MTMFLSKCVLTLLLVSIAHIHCFSLLSDYYERLKGHHLADDPAHQYTYVKDVMTLASKDFPAKLKQGAIPIVFSRHGLALRYGQDSYVMVPEDADRIIEGDNLFVQEHLDELAGLSDYLKEYFHLDYPRAAHLGEQENRLKRLLLQGKFYTQMLEHADPRLVDPLGVTDAHQLKYYSHDLLDKLDKPPLVITTGSTRTKETAETGLREEFIDKGWEWEPRVLSSLKEEDHFLNVRDLPHQDVRKLLDCLEEEIKQLPEDEKEQEDLAEDLFNQVRVALRKMRDDHKEATIFSNKMLELINRRDKLEFERKLNPKLQAMNEHQRTESLEKEFKNLETKLEELNEKKAEQLGYENADALRKMISDLSEYFRLLQVAETIRRTKDETSPYSDADRKAHEEYLATQFVEPARKLREEDLAPLHLTPEMGLEEVSRMYADSIQKVDGDPKIKSLKKEVEKQKKLLKSSRRLYYRELPQETATWDELSAQVKDANVERIRHTKNFDDEAYKVDQITFKLVKLGKVRYNLRASPHTKDIPEVLDKDTIAEFMKNGLIPDFMLAKTKLGPEKQILDSVDKFKEVGEVIQNNPGRVIFIVGSQNLGIQLLKRKFGYENGPWEAFRFSLPEAVPIPFVVLP